MENPFSKKENIEITLKKFKLQFKQANVQFITLKKYDYILLFFNLSTPQEYVIKFAINTLAMILLVLVRLSHGGRDLIKISNLRKYLSVIISAQL